MTISVYPTFRGPLHVVFNKTERWFFNPQIVTAKNSRQKRLQYFLTGKTVNGVTYYYDPQHRAFFRDGKTLPETLG